ncbi:MAG: FecR domain-containing protein, partial [Anaerolineae bacterium]|nr:FecR domain-containing protein [Anaerolineae bacterium]
MRAIEDRFEEQWNRLQAGQRLADCQAMLPDDEAELLALAASLGDAPTPARDRGAVAGQRARLLSLAARQLAPVPHGRRQASPAPAGAEPARRPFWQAVVPQTPLARGLALALLLAVALVGASLAWRAARNDGATPAPVAVAPIEKLEPSAQPATVAPTLAAATRAASPRLAVAAPASGASAASPSAPAPSSAPALSAAVEPTRAAYLSAVLRPMTAEDAVLRDSRGLVQVQRDEGPWELADSGQVVGAGWRVRTGALSGVRLAFHDGSSARLGPESELSLEALGLLPDTGARRVELRQWRGESDHLVTPAPDGRYVVHTPAGSGAALGTHFQVHVSAEAGTRFAVAEGAVEVTHLEVSVVVVAGQATLVEPESPPDQPIFRVYGEGRVEAIGAVWRIGGQDFQTHAGTLILGDPHLGDWVAVEGRLAPDGTRLADRVELLERAPAPEFSLVGPLETMAAELWVIAGQSISITAQTDV